MTVTHTLHPNAMAAKYDTGKVWRSCIHRWRASLTLWTASRTSDGQLMVSAEVRGRDAAAALRSFARRQTVVLEARPDRLLEDLLPALDVSEEGRTACVWRTRGVWVRLWHTDPDPGPVLVSPAVRRAGFISAARGRFPFTRKPRTTNPKESATA